MATTRNCTVCGKGFEPRFRFQVEEVEGAAQFYCTQKCQQAAIGARKGADAVACTGCGKAFSLEFAWQVAVAEGQRRYACSEGCKHALTAPPPPVAAGERRGPHRIAVFNHKGGTGKTTTAINVAAGLAERGPARAARRRRPAGQRRCLPRVRGEQTLYHVLVLGRRPARGGHPRALQPRGHHLQRVARRGRALPRRAARRDRILRERMVGSDAYDVVVLDCSPSLSLLNQNALCYADAVLIPVSCDYLALVGVKQCVRTLRGVHEHLKHPVYILGVIPTFYDARHKLGREVTDTLRAKFGDALLEPRCAPT
jgi:chromosome partitioning protein